MELGNKVVIYYGLFTSMVWFVYVTFLNAQHLVATKSYLLLQCMILCFQNLCELKLSIYGINLMANSPISFGNFDKIYVLFECDKT